MSAAAEQETTATKIRRLVDVRIEITPGGGAWAWEKPERLAQQYENWAREFNEFLRDHRSQDANGLEVCRDYAVICSACEEPCEAMTDPEEPGVFCANCGARLEGH